MRRNALCIGINNYPGTDSDLRGCVNDADDWAAALAGLGFNVSVLADRAASRANILAAVRLTVGSLRGPGDVCVVSYSGHGTWMPDLDGDEPDGKDEAICPSDMGKDGANLVLDDELSVLFAARPRGARVVLVTDSCHSGSVFRFVASPSAPPTKAKYMPPAHFARDPRLVAAIERLGPQGRPASDDPVPGVVHLAGCRDVEYSFDSVIGGRPNGVLTRTALDAMAALGAGATYAGLAAAIRRSLPSAEYPQSPRLNATKAERGLPLFT